MYWGARALGGQVYSEYIGGDLLRQHSPTLRCYLKSTLSTCHRMCPEISFVNKQAWNGLQSQYNVFPVPFSTFHIHVMLDHSPAGHGSDC